MLLWCQTNTRQSISSVRSGIRVHHVSSLSTSTSIFQICLTWLFFFIYLTAMVLFFTSTGKSKPYPAADPHASLSSLSWHDHFSFLLSAVDPPATIYVGRDKVRTVNQDLLLLQSFDWLLLSSPSHLQVESKSSSPSPNSNCHHSLTATQSLLLLLNLPSWFDRWRSDKVRFRRGKSNHQTSHQDPTEKRTNKSSSWTFRESFSYLTLSSTFRSLKFPFALGFWFHRRTYGFTLTKWVLSSVHSFPLLPLAHSSPCHLLSAIHISSFKNWYLSSYPQLTSISDFRLLNHGRTFQHLSLRIVLNWLKLIV